MKKRQKKKNLKKKQLKKVQQSYKKSEVKKMSQRDIEKAYNTIVSQEEKKQQKRKREQERYNRNKAFIEQNNLHGYGVNPRSSQKNLESALRRKQRDVRVSKKRKQLLNISGIDKDYINSLSDNQIDKLSFKRISNVSRETYPLAFKTDLHVMDKGFYLGFFSNSDNSLWLIQNSMDYYKNKSVEYLKRHIVEILDYHKSGGSSGVAGDMRFRSDDVSGIESYINYQNALGYSDVILPEQKEFSTKGFLCLVNAILENAREDNRKQLYTDIKSHCKHYCKSLYKYLP